MMSLLAFVACPLSRMKQCITPIPHRGESHKAAFYMIAFMLRFLYQLRMIGVAPLNLDVIYHSNDRSIIPSSKYWFWRFFLWPVSLSRGCKTSRNTNTSQIVARKFHLQSPQMVQKHRKDATDFSRSNRIHRCRRHSGRHARSWAKLMQH